MASWMNNLRNFGRGTAPRSNSNQNPSPVRTNTSSPSPYSPASVGPYNPQAASTTSLHLTNNMQSNEHVPSNGQGVKKIPLFFREEYSNFIVKGNFMTLAAKPLLVEEGEWIAHQVVEQNRLLGGMVKIVQSEDRSSGKSLCNDQGCSTMAAGSVVYNWVDTRGNPINLAAPKYIANIQTWVAGKIQDDSLFPTAPCKEAPPLPNPTLTANDPTHFLGKTSGFPQRFEGDVKAMYKQMFRCYAHLYWQHWLQFWELNATRELNTCFVHFVNVGRSFNLLSDKDTEPMQPLIDVWLRLGHLPQLNQSTPAPASSAVPSGSASAATTGSTT